MTKKILNSIERIMLIYMIKHLLLALNKEDLEKNPDMSSREVLPILGLLIHSPCRADKILGLCQAAEGIGSETVPQRSK